LIKPSSEKQGLGYAILGLISRRCLKQYGKILKKISVLTLSIFSRVGLEKEQGFHENSEASSNVQMKFCKISPYKSQLRRDFLWCAKGFFCALTS
jgi:hypothetical protein